MRIFINFLFLILDEYVVEMENTKLDHDQEILRLKAQIPKVPPPSKLLVFHLYKMKFFIISKEKNNSKYLFISNDYLCDIFFRIINKLLSNYSD